MRLSQRPINTRHTHGFTLIELLITTALGMILMMAVSTMFFVTTLNSAKIEARKRLKNTGEDIKRNINFMLKNSIKLLPNDSGQVCTDTSSTLSSLKLKNIDGGITNLALVDDGGNLFIASNSTKLNQAEVRPTNLQFVCINNPAGETYVNYQFDLAIGSLANQHFTGFVLLRNN
jgi:prepilin-type N-terminal cleavage/methylation domain-containing protein